MITDTSGRVALVYYQPVPKVFIFKDIDKTISLDVKYGIPLVWAEPDLVPRLMALKGGCCGRRDKSLFHYATQNEVQVHATGHY